MLKLKLQYFGQLMRRVDSLEKTLMLGGIGGQGEGDSRGWNGWMASLTQWTWVCVNSGSSWWTGRPGELWFMGSPRVGHDWATELNWTGLQGDQTSSILKKFNPEYSFEELTLQMKLQYLATWCEQLTHWKRCWCWQRLKSKKEEGGRGWDGWMASPSQWMWVWANSGLQEMVKDREARGAAVHGVTRSRTRLSDCIAVRSRKEMAPQCSSLAWKIPWREEPGRLQSMGSQRVGHDWATELNWTERSCETSAEVHLLYHTQANTVRSCQMKPGKIVKWVSTIRELGELLSLLRDKSKKYVLLFSCMMYLNLFQFVIWKLVIDIVWIIQQYFVKFRS